MLTKKDIAIIQGLLGPIVKRTINLERSLRAHTMASQKEHKRLQQSINRLVAVYEVDDAKTNARLGRIERTLDYASA